MKHFQVFQGDIGIEGDKNNLVRPLPDNLSFSSLPKEGVIVAEGEVTGHKHILTADKNSIVKLAQVDGRLILRVKEGSARLTHNKHDVQVFPARQEDYVIIRQTEWDELGERNVVD